ncbi:MAG TPA: ABC transporter ATP-binding protein, partial [Polyangiaceae bacterium]|nr:ABC transporter ATP-binding protein [Polyangiaceae bacterium]
MSDSSIISSERARGHVVRRLLALTWRYRWRSLLVLVYQAILLGMTLGVVGLTGLSVDVIRAAIDPTAPSPRWLPGLVGLAVHQPETALALLGLLILVMALAGAALNYGYSLEVGRLVHLELVPALRLELYQKLQRLGFRFFDAHPSGAIINRVTRDVQMLRSFVDGVVIQGAVLLLALGFFLAYMLSTHVWLTLVSVMLLPLVYVTTVLFSRWVRPAYLKNRELSDQMVRVLTESIEGISVIKVFGQEAERQRSFTEKNQAVRTQQVGIFRAVSRFTPLIDLLNHLNLAVLMAYGVVLIARHEITLGDLIAFAGLLQQFARRASSMASIVDTLQQSLTGARRVFDVLDQPLGVEEQARPSFPGRLRGEVELHQLGFEYGQGVPVLTDISLRVRAGECIGILGRAGSGKSTLLSLISRFYDPTRGSVSIDGVDVKDF